MTKAATKVLSIVPYRILPPNSGGHQSIVLLHHYLGLLCENHIICTEDNVADNKYSFHLYKILPAGLKRYVPNSKLSEIAKIAIENEISCIICEHPYMAPTAISLSKKLKIPWFLRSQNIESQRFKTYGKKWWPLLQFFERRMMRKADGIFFITPEDMQWAKEKFKVKGEKCHVILYGTILDKPPLRHSESKRKLAEQLQLDEKIPWLYFLGANDFYPNEQAVSFILGEIMPRLNKNGINYQALIAGKGLNDNLRHKIENTPKIIYTGFIPDLDDFINACDIMLNPVILGGGIKTKAVEALGYNKIIISAFSGSAGLIPDACGSNLFISPDYDWDVFTDNIIKAIRQTPSIPSEYYDTYYWGNIAKKVLSILQKS